MTTDFTRVTLVTIPGRMNIWLRFGYPQRELAVTPQKSVVDFTPGAVFCRIRWQANAYGTTVWRLMVLQAAEHRQPMQRLIGVEPGAIVLLHVVSEKAVKRAFAVIDAIERQQLDPAHVAPSYWRTVHNRLAANVTVPAYTPERQASYELRKACV